MTIYQNAETGGEGSAGGSGVVLGNNQPAEAQNIPITETPEFKAALSEAVTGLQNKNHELIDTQKKLKERLTLAFMEKEVYK